MKEVAPSRSQKRLMKHLSKAAERHDRLLDEDKVSLESGLGQLAIIVSSRKNFRSVYTNPSELGRETRYFVEEAERLAAERASRHQEVVVRRRAVARDMALDFANPEVTDIILIGHGSIECMWTDPKGYFTWRDAAKSAVRLKRGKIEQRMCGDFSTTAPYQVPLATFAVADFRDVLAATGKVIPDRDPADALFQPVYDGSGDVLAQIDALNERYMGNTTVADDTQGSSAAGAAA